MNRNLLLLTLCQGLFFTNNVTFIAINGLVGLQLAPLGWMATLPIMAYVGGGALAAPLVARHQRRFGRKRCFQLGLGVAIVSAALCALAAALRKAAHWQAVAVAACEQCGRNRLPAIGEPVGLPDWLRGLDPDDQSV
ncbi:MAG TPA: 16S rRNA (uracil(1498)-N(3))-methyltransferase, partial [Burkholderiaceae bacterium]|nr:16S rRNA (uracil(1498)-N(3))-methyltransferase [Burkholderiaceae bacterium]